MNIKLGEKVVVSAAVTGDGVQHTGMITDIYEFAHETFVEVKFNYPSSDGRLGCIVNNLGMVRKEVLK